VRMGLDQRKVSVDESKLVTHIASHSLYDGMGTPAVRAFKITVLDESHRSIAGAECVVAIVYRNR
jgi:hypothetical protein